MSTSTTRLALVKPALTDAPDITAINPNADTLDKAVVAASSALGTVVAATTVQTILNYTVPTTGLYRVGGYVKLNNSVDGNAVTFEVIWIDPNDGAGQQVYLEPAVRSGAATAPSPPMNGANGYGNADFPLGVATVYAKAATAITVLYQDPTNTPNDTVSAAIERVV